MPLAWGHLVTQLRGAGPGARANMPPKKRLKGEDGEAVVRSSAWHDALKADHVDPKDVPSCAGPG